MGKSWKQNSKNYGLRKAKQDKWSKKHGGSKHDPRLTDNKSEVNYDRDYINN